MREHDPAVWRRRRLSGMKRLLSRIVVLGIAGLFGVQLAHGQGQGQGQAYPAKPIRVIIPYVAGGVLDLLMRSLNQVVSDSIAQPVFIENRPGASSQLSLSACAKSAPDGYTICTTSGEGMSFGPILFPSLPYDPDKDFIPITNLVWINGVIAANGSMPFDNMREMIDYAKARPGALNWGSFGVASTPHMYLEWIKHQAGVNITHVPYKGVAQVFPAMISGEIQTAYYAMGIVLPQVRSGKVKVLAVTTPQRSPYLPTVPTLAEQGLDPGISAWFGLLAPARTSATVIDRLHAEFAKALHNPNFQEKFLKVQAYDAVGNSPAEFAEFIKTDRAFASRIVKLTGIRPEN